MRPVVARHSSSTSKSDSVEPQLSSLDYKAVIEKDTKCTPQHPDSEYTLRHSARMPTSTLEEADKPEDISYYTADHIKDEKKGRVLVVWSGIDATTGLPYEPSWVRRQDCTEELLTEWDESKKGRRHRPTQSLSSYHDKLSESSSAKTFSTPALLFKKQRPLRAPTSILRSSSSPGIKERDIFDFPSDEDSPEERARVRKKQRRSANSPAFEPSLSEYESALSQLQATFDSPSARARHQSQRFSASPASTYRSLSGSGKARHKQQISKSVPLATARLPSLESPQRNQTAFGESIIGTFESVKLSLVPIDPHLPIITKDSLRHDKPQTGRRSNGNKLFWSSSTSLSESASLPGSHSPSSVFRYHSTEQLSSPSDVKKEYSPEAPFSPRVSASVIDISDEHTEPARESQSQASDLEKHSEANPSIDPLSQSQSLFSYKTTISDSDPQISDVSVRTLLKPISDDSPSTKDLKDSVPSQISPDLIEVPATASQERAPLSESSPAELDTSAFVEDSQYSNQNGPEASARQELSLPERYSKESPVNSPVPDSQANESAPVCVAGPFTLVEEDTLDRVEGWLSSTPFPSAKTEAGDQENMDHLELDSFPRPAHLDTQVLNASSNVSLNTTEPSAPAKESILQESSPVMQDVEVATTAASPEQKETPASTSPHSASKAMTEGLASGVARLPDNNVTDGSITLDKYRLGPAEYAVPVGLRDFQRQMYEQVLILHSSEILRFCDFGSSSKAFRDRLAPDMLKVLNRTLLAATHPYLLVPTLMPRNLSDKDESRYIVHSSEKFRILDNIITVFKENGLKLGIVAREGHTMDTVSNFLGGRRIKYARRDGTSESEAATDEENVNSDHEAFAKVTVVIVPSTATDNYAKKKKFSLPKVDLVVALDASFIGSELQVRQLRGVTNEGDIPDVPVLRLVSVNTSEHALLSAAATLGLHDSVIDTEVLSSIITAVTLLRAQAGKLPDSVVKEIDAMPAKLPAWLAGGCATVFPVSLIAPSADRSFSSNIPSTMFLVRAFTPADVDDALSSLSGESIVSELLDVLDAENQTSLTLTIETALRHILKCARAADDIDGGSVVRQSQQPSAKMTIVPSLLEQDGSSYPHQDFSHDHLEGSDVVMHNDEDDFHSEADLDALTINEKEEMIRQLREQKLSTQLALRSKESELAHYKEHHSNLLIRYENADKMMNQLIANNEELEARVKTAERRIERGEAEKSRLREQIADIKVKLQTAEQTLLDGTADMRELQQLRSKVTELEDENKKLSDKLHNRNTETEYMRAEYQKASIAAAEAALDLKAVQEANEELRRKVNGDMVRLKRMQWDSEREQKDQMIKELNLRIENLESSVKRLQLDRQGTRGRYGVRSSSVPRRGLSPATRSRASSPATTGTVTPTSAPASSHPLQYVFPGP
ncbi:class II histone deacetylase complex subunits 2 and 3-domain-containing protein [Lipomyces kononenkoae]|uniref:Class II histone deacetylase complex subunits 2 and 3-domain-containing protein n=1 Tax=Lipomyces kononenkoae TaxID=34357 RepID=A0ACC3TB29_LIPKO